MGRLAPTHDEPVTFRCRACDAALADASAVCEQDGEPFMPAGAYCPNAGVFFNRFDGWWAVNLSDAINTRHHHDARRPQGCCGPDGSDGPNTLLRLAALCCDAGAIRKVWYPVFPPDRNARTVLEWIIARPGRETRVAEASRPRGTP